MLYTKRQLWFWYCRMDELVHEVAIILESLKLPPSIVMFEGFRIPMLSCFRQLARVQSSIEISLGSSVGIKTPLKGFILVGKVYSVEGLVFQWYKSGLNMQDTLHLPFIEQIDHNQLIFYWNIQYGSHCDALDQFRQM